jgi:hypothetical protein
MNCRFPAQRKMRAIPSPQAEIWAVDQFEKFTSGAKAPLILWR